MGVKKNPQSPMYTQLGVMTKGTIIEVNVSELGMVTAGGKVVFGKYAQITNNPENDGCINAVLRKSIDIFQLLRRSSNLQSSCMIVSPTPTCTFCNITTFPFTSYPTRGYYSTICFPTYKPSLRIQTYDSNAKRTAQ